MAIDFPASPTNGQTFTSGSVTYTWDGTKWTAVAAGGGATDKITEGNTSAEVIDTGSDGRFVVTTEGSERARVDSSGRLLVGTSTSRNDFFNGTTTVAGGIQLELSASDNLNRFMSFTSNNSDTGGPSFLFGKSRGTTANSKTVVQSDDQLAAFNFHGADGSDMVEAARISAHVDGTPGANDMPGRLVFATTADGAASPTERVRIDSTGLVTLTGPGIKFPATQVASADANTLDDYEEGTWTPSISNAYNSPPTVTYTAQTGTYTKIGRVVTAAFHIDIASFSGGGGPVFFSGLPFAPATTTDSRFQCAVYLSGVNTPASTVSVNLGYAKADNGTYYLVFNCVRDDTAMANAGMLVTGDFAAGDVIGGTFTYFV